MKKIVYLVILLLLTAVAYFGIVRPAADLVYIVDSELQGRKIFMGGEWGFIPEAFIPGLVKIQKVPRIKRFSEKLQFTLPYAALLDYFEVYRLEVEISGEWTLQNENISALYEREYGELEKIFVARIRHRLEQIISENSTNPAFTKEDLLTGLGEKKLGEGLNYQINVIYFPSWVSYFSIRKKLEDSVNNSESVVIRQLLENYRQLLAGRAERKNWVEHFELLSELAGKLSQTPQKEMILELYNLMSKGKSTNERNEKNLAEKGS